MMQKNTLLAGLRLLLAVIVSLPTVRAWAAGEVNVEKAGTLSTLITGNEISLTLTGSINGTDVKYLRELTNSGKLISLDLSGVRIVSGGEAYYESYTTQNDVIGQNMFSGCSKLRTIVLPTTVSEILSNAFSRSGIRKVEIPNSVSHLGGDAFAYCSSLTTVVIGSRVTRLDQGVFYSSAVSMAYVKPLTPPATPAYLFSSKPTIRVYSDALTDYQQSSWANYGSIVGKLETVYPMEEDSSTVVNSLRDTYFEDAACTRLRAEYQAMTDEQLVAAMNEGGMPSFMADIAVKLKNGSWADYEQDFRIHEYKAYSDASYWNNKLMSSGGSYMGNPTGIWTSDYDPLYVFVDSDVPSDATLYIAGCTGNSLISSAKTGKKLARGLNIVDAQKDALYYIVYTADTQSMTKTLDQWPAIKIHIEGGKVNGYYDVSRHSDSDYQALLKAATYERFTVRGGQSLFNFKTSTYKTVWPRTIDKSICWFDSLTVWQKELMGFCESVATGQRAHSHSFLTGGESIFPIYYNNPNFAIEGEDSDAGYANSTSYRTSYNSVTCIRNSFDVSRAELDDWCAAHECGHNNQRAINLEGGTEVSNNLFSNYIRYLDGLVTSSGSPLSTVMNEYASHTPFFFRPVDSQLRMYWQLYLYYHLAQKNTAFYPTLFQELRKDPLALWSNTYNSSLKFVRKVCEVAGEDLTEFFTAWGFFEPVTNRALEDYGSHTLTVRQTDINRTLNEISKYPKNRTILFIEDRADYVLTTDFLTTAGQKRRGSDLVGQCGHLGQFTDYMPEAMQASAYTYRQADSLYAMAGSGGVGFLMLNNEGKMVYAANSRNFCIPTSVEGDFTIYSVDADGTLHEAVPDGEGAEVVNVPRAGALADSLSALAIKATVSGYINGTDIKYMRQLLNEGNLASIDLANVRVMSGGVAYYESYRSVANSMGDHAFYNCKQLIAIRLPEKIVEIKSNAFACSGLREAVIPDAVTTVGGDAFAYCDQLSRVVVGPKVRTMSQGVFYSSPVQHAYVYPTTPPSIAAYLFSSKPVIHVYSRALAAYQASSWAGFGTLVGDLDDYTPVETVRSELPQPVDVAPVYDLTGRRVTRLQPGTIYVRKGRKFVTAP